MDAAPAVVGCSGMPLRRARSRAIHATTCSSGFASPLAAYRPACRRPSSGRQGPHEHVAGLGSVPSRLSPADRIAFWTKLHQRLDTLGNRVDAARRGAILTAIHARIPMPTQDDQQAVQLERAQADARFWETLAEMHTDDIEGHKGLLASAQRAIAEREPLAADTAAKAQAAKDRLARVEQGEDVAGHPAPMTREDMLRISGMTEASCSTASASPGSLRPARTGGG